ncbi:hypothetical protein PGT21_019552 [Puccinia graminis f. sp. tritici]|uniref:Uncharacterized protein n=2 Tax=Puccinia graminis f. sp. tritici TaxID=56615 RepID=E3KF63_PUCGT|nr:uncharacterized protein PGTG_09858 [Puccinia graminis f. sp. tritici CRL 75-36-700-3]EFP82890.1 hypothetical protein PGTG_09858 [Puccinia graminis f. sp. tritici CRL 75-36-700-3]KAA1069278.1 hypothetical protein PGT21_019552 [Puccinia graminis f. sp. tritici]
MEAEPSNIPSSPLAPDNQFKTAQSNEPSGHRLKEDSSAGTSLLSSSRSKGRGTKSRMINVGGNRLESPSHSSRHKTDSFRPSSSRRANLASNEWMSNPLDENQMSPRITTKIVDKELASHYNDIGDPFLEEDPSYANLPSLNDPSTEPTPGTASSSEPPANHALESSDMNENTAIASPPGSPITS